MKEKSVNFGLQGVTGKFVEASDDDIAEIETQCGFTQDNLLSTNFHFPGSGDGLSLWGT